MLEDISTAFLETIDSKGSIEVAILMRRTGTIIGAWTKGDISREIVSVMAATMLGSIETISEALACPSPERALVETDRCRIFAETFEPHGVLVLVARKDLSADDLRRASLHIRARLSAASGGAEGARPAVPAQIRRARPFHDR
jgi:predicted regulator of Ras-like GTPase activity (Roadblock/LC7/MglB family)